MTFDFIKRGNAVNTDAEWLVITDENYSVCADATRKLEKFLSDKPDAAAVSFRITPTDTGVNYEPVTLKTAYVSECAFAVKRSVFTDCGGFDDELSRYRCRELSYRLRAYGEIFYCPFVTAERITPYGAKADYIGRIADTVYTAYKYGSKDEISAAEKDFQNAVKNPQHFDGIRKDLAKKYRSHFLKTAHFSRFRKQNSGLFAKSVRNFTPFESADRGRYTAEETDFSPYISVVIRTHERKEMLRRTLSCLRNQIYTNFQVVVAEDGENTAESMINSDFRDMNIKYFATGENVGRGRRGNLGIEAADGEYICFLDDDDYYYADYLSSFVSFLSSRRDADMAICDGMRYETDIICKNPYEFTVGNTYSIHFDRINLMDMCVKCRIPMPCCIFRKELYYKAGGMREDIGGDEDWAMWLKFLKIRRRADENAPDIHRALCLFGYPADKMRRANREKAYAEYDRVMLSDENLLYTVTKDTLTEWENAVKGDAMHLKNTGLADEYTKTLTNLGSEEIVCENDGKVTVTALQINRFYRFLLEKYLK